MEPEVVEVDDDSPCRATSRAKRERSASAEQPLAAASRRPLRPESRCEGDGSLASACAGAEGSAFRLQLSGNVLGPLAATQAASGWQAALTDHPRRSFASLRRGAFAAPQLKDWYWLCDRSLPWARPLGAAGDPLPRDAAWLVSPGCACCYEYAARSWSPSAMPPWFLQLTRAVCDACGVPEMPNACNANRYVSGAESVGWHADAEPLFDAMGERDVLILSLSLGAARTFKLRLTSAPGTEAASVVLQDGDMCTMEGHCQRYYQHCVPKEARVLQPRINLTWRWIVAHSTNCPLGVEEGPLREKLQQLADAKGKLEALKRRRVEQQSPGQAPDQGAVAEKLASLAEARRRLNELQSRRAQLSKG